MKELKSVFRTNVLFPTKLRGKEMGMKVKLTVMTLLVVGLVIGLSGSALAKVTISMSDKSINDVFVELNTTGIPATSLVYENDSVAAVTIQQVALETVGTATSINYSIWLDADKNGIVSWGDTEILAATAVPGVAGVTVADVTDFTVPAGNGQAWLLIVLDDAGAAANLETIAIGADPTASNNVAAAGVFFENDTTVGFEPDATTGNVATIGMRTDDNDETFTQAADPSPVAAAGNVPNATNEVALVNFKLTAGANFGQVLNSINLVEGANYLSASGLTVDASVDSIRVYIDNGTVGTLDGADVRVPLANHLMAADPTDIVLATGIYKPATESVTILITGSLTGANPTGEDVALTVDTSGHVVSGDLNGVSAGMGVDVDGAAMTVDALEYVAYTQDITGPPYNRPNGLIDAVRLNFTVDGSAANVDDATVTAAIGEFGIVGLGAPTFSSTYNGDVANDSKVYLRGAEGAVTTATGDVPNVTYSGNVRVLTVDGEYGVAADAGTAATDLAPPAILSVTTLDGTALADDENGKLDTIQFVFSEDLNAASAAGFTVAGYTVDGAAFNAAGNHVLDISIEELDDYDTGAKPNYAYDTSLSTLSDGAAGNQVASFNQGNVPVFDGAAPTLVEGMTLDADDDGMFDTLKLVFSEPVQLNPAVGGLTAVDITDNNGLNGFNFGSDHNGVYDFTDTGNTGLGTAELLLPVNEVGSFDTAVIPSLDFNRSGGAGTEVLTDFAATPNMFGVADGTGAEFDLVTAAAAADDEVWMQDGISARVTNGAWLDTDTNGKLDTIEITFSEPMGLNASDYAGLTIEDHTIEGATIVGPVVNVEVNEDDYDTGDTPDVTYSGDTIVDLNGAAMMAIASDDITELDGAFPIAYAVETLDDGESAGSADNNGHIDGILVKFSEKVNNTFLDNTAAERLADEFDVTGYAVTGAALVASGPGWAPYYNSMIIEITELVGADTDATPFITYSAVGDSNLVDLNDLPFQTIAPATVQSTDTAPPAVITATTIDDNTDGYIDGVLMEFSENIVIASADTSKIFAAVTLEEINNAIDLTGAALTATATTVELIGTSSMTEAGWDTGLLPNLAFASSSGIKDAAGNEVDEESTIDTVDGAAPVIGKAEGTVGAATIDIWFSEPVTNDTGAPIDQGDVVYYSADPEVTVTITSINDKSDADASTFQAITSANLTVANVRDDSIRVVAGAIEDGSPATNVAPVDTVAISDAVAPVLDSAVTLDVNQDGVIDNIMMVFTEAIFQDYLLGHNGGKNDTTVCIGQVIGFDEVFTVEGFHVYGYNLTRDADDAVAATAKLRLSGILSSADPDVANVGDFRDDRTIYLMVKPLVKPEKGATDVTTTISFLSGDDTVGSGLADKAQNFVPSVSDFPVEDGAAPIIWSATLDNGSNGMVLDILFTETLEADLPLARDTFAWLVGTEEVDYGDVGGSGLTYIVNFEALDDEDENDRLYHVDVVEGYAVKSGDVSTIEYRGANEINDANGNPNLANIHDPIDVTPPDYIPDAVEGEEEVEVPEVYALSKNFPNPFNPTTTINYDIAGDGGHVSMVIYNMTGQKVRTLVNEVKAPGFYSAVWDGTNERGEAVASGIYIYKLVSGNFSQFEKMTFIK